MGSRAGHRSVWFGQFQPAVNNKFSIPVGDSGRTSRGFSGGLVGYMHSLPANQKEYFFFPNNDICFFLVESRGQIFMYNKGKKMEEKARSGPK
jgi:hypothetical protein